MTEPALRAGVYCRISEHDANVPKVENQEASCRALSKENGYEVVDVFVDDGISAYKRRTRPGWDQMEAAVRAGSIDVIVTVALDRLARDHISPLILMRTCAENGVQWHAKHEGLLDPKNPTAQVMAFFGGWKGEHEITGRTAKQRERYEAERLAGRPLWGVRPFGFEVDRITHRPVEAKEIAWAYATVISTGKLYPVLKDWNSRGVLTSRGNKWSYATLQQLLRRASNAGLIEHNGEVREDVAAQWQPIVSRDDWQTVVAILSDPNRRIVANREPKHLLAGLVHCGVCGSVMRSSGSTNRPGEKIYRCATKITAQGDGRRHASVRITDLDPIVRKAVIDSYFVSAPGAMPTHDEDVAELGALHARLSEVRQGIADLFESIGQPGYTKARVDSAVARLSEEEANLSGQIEGHARQSAHAAMVVDALHLMAPKGGKVSFDDASKHKEALAARFDALDLEQRRTLVRSLVRVTVHGGRRLKDRIEVEHVGAPVLNAEGDPWCA